MPLNRFSSIKNWLFSLTLIASSVAILTISSREFYPADYYEWQNDWGLLLNYIHSKSSIPFTDLSKFTLAYLINSCLSGENNKNLEAINFIFLLIPILCLVLMHGWRIAITTGSIFLCSLIFSPIPIYYINSGALEIQSAIVAGIFISSLGRLAFYEKREQSKILIYLLVLSGFLLPAYKDTIVAVIAFGFILLVFLKFFIPSFFSFSEPTKESILMVIKFGALPTLLGVMTCAVYNMAKYGVFLPVVYLIESRETSPDIFKSLEFFVGSILSPNGGVIIFWMMSFVIAICGWRAAGYSPRKSVVWLSVICVVLTLFGLAKWWAPFGWDSWGNRLAIPLIFGAMVAMLLSLEPIDSKNILRTRFFKKFKKLKIFLMCFVIILPIYYLLVPYRSSSFSDAMQASLNPGPACNNMYHALQNETFNMGLKFWKSEIYYDCARERMMHLPTPR
jgi:hypothetical protein